MYKIVEGEIKRIRPFCPRCGRGVFMADHGDFYSCGKCGDRYSKNYVKARRRTHWRVKREQMTKDAITRQ